MAECTPNLRASYDAAETTPRSSRCPPTTTAFPFNSGSNSSSTETKKASIATWKIVWGKVLMGQAVHRSRLDFTKTAGVRDCASAGQALPTIVYSLLIVFHRDEDLDDSAALVNVCVVHHVCGRFVRSGGHSSDARCSAGAKNRGAGVKSWQFDL